MGAEKPPPALSIWAALRISVWRKRCFLEHGSDTELEHRCDAELKLTASAPPFQNCSGILNMESVLQRYIVWSADLGKNVPRAEIKSSRCSGIEGDSPKPGLWLRVIPGVQ